MKAYTDADTSTFQQAWAAYQVIAFLRGQGIRAAVGGTAAMRFHGWNGETDKAADVDLLASRAPEFSPEDFMRAGWKFDGDPSWASHVGSPVVDGIKVDILPVGAKYQDGLTHADEERAWLAAASPVRVAANLTIPVFRLQDAFAWKWAAGRPKDIAYIRNQVRGYVRPDWYPWLDEYRAALEAIDRLAGEQLFRRNGY